MPKNIYTSVISFRHVLIHPVILETQTCYQVTYLTLSTLSDDMWVMLSRLPCNWSLTTSSKSSIFSEPLLRVRCCNTPSQLYILYRLIVKEGTKEGTTYYFWSQTLWWAWRLGREVNIDRQRKITGQVLLLLDIFVYNSPPFPNLNVAEPKQIYQTQHLAIRSLY